MTKRYLPIKGAYLVNTRYVIGVLLLLALMGCRQGESNFSQYPGFKEYFDINVPSDALPSQSDQALLHRFRPRIFLKKDQPPFIDFYNDYIAYGALYIDGKEVSNSVDQTLLNTHKNTLEAEFRHRKNKNSTTPTLYARISRDTLVHDGNHIELTFLRYNLVFATSGLPRGIAGWQRALIGLIGSNEDWHQLDHYVGLSVVLNNDNPIAVMLQQHNYQTTWLLSESIHQNTLALPKDGRIAVDVALQSNELYPHSKERVEHPSVSFIKAESIAFIKDKRDKPLMAGWDITHGQQEIAYSLRFLAPSDAFYTFKGKLGQHRSLPGRSGPPGADYVTLPELLPLTNQLVTGYRPQDVTTEKSKLEALFSEESFSINPEGLKSYRQDFMNDMHAFGLLNVH